MYYSCESSFKVFVCSCGLSAGWDERALRTIEGGGMEATNGRINCNQCKSRIEATSKDDAWREGHKPPGIYWRKLIRSV